MYTILGKDKLFIRENVSVKELDEFIDNHDCRLGTLIVINNLTKARYEVA